MKFLFSIVLIIISGALFFSIVNPLYGQVGELRTQVAMYNTALDNAGTLQKTRDQLVDMYKNINPQDRERLEHFLPNSVNNIKFILEIERIANLHSMPINNIKFQPVHAEAATIPTGKTIVTSTDPATRKAYGTFPIEFTTEGNYDTFALFLKDIEHNLRLVDVNSISFDVPTEVKVSQGPDPKVFVYSLKVETYWLK